VQTHVATCACATAADVEELPDRDDLESLDVELDDGVDPSKLARLTHLRALTLRNAKADDVPRVATLTSLEHLTLSFPDDHPVDTAALSAIPNLHDLKIVTAAPQSGSACR
jgi:hypothetical protein